MTKGRVGNELPKALTALAVIYWSKPVPIYVDAVLQPIIGALLKCSASGRFEYLNRKMSQMKRRRNADFVKMAAWLQLPSTRCALRRAGHPDLGSTWINALNKFQNGTKFSTAFSSRGRSRSWKFSGARLSAIYAMSLNQVNANMTFDEAVGEATNFGQYDEREIRRAMLSIPVSVIDKHFFPVADDNKGI
jgi:hypothetical protein